MEIKPIIGSVAMLIASESLFAESLIETAGYTINTSPDVEIVKNQYLSSLDRIGVAKSGHLPTVDLALGFGQEFTNSPSTRAAQGNSDSIDLDRGEASLTLSQPLYDGNNTLNDVDRTESEALAQRYELWNTAENLTLDVANAYTALFYARELSLLAKDNLQAHKEILEGINKRLDHGLGSSSDLSQVKGRLSRAHSNFIATENNVLDAQVRFFKLVGKSGTELEAHRSLEAFIPATYDQALEAAGREHPALISAQHDVEAATAQLKLRDTAFRPDVRFEVTGNWDNNIEGIDGHNNEVVAAVRLNYNLFNGFADKHSKQEGYHQLQEAYAVRDRAKREVSEGLHLSWNAYELLARQLEFLQSHVVESEKTLDGYKQQFDLGRRTLVDLLDAENELFEARTDLLSAKRDHAISQFRVLNGMGKLLETLSIDRKELLN